MEEFELGDGSYSGLDIVYISIFFVFMHTYIVL